MAEGGRDSASYLSPLEEQYLQECEADDDLDQQLQREKELAAQKLWQAFQDSATAVAHMFKDCQQQAGLAAWVPFHESASAVTQLYRGSSEVCRQCMECGVKYGQRKKTKEIITWAKKKRKHIRREELLAFLLDKPYPGEHNTNTTSTGHGFGTTVNVATSTPDRHENYDYDSLPPSVIPSHSHQLGPHQLGSIPHQCPCPTLQSTNSIMSGCSCCLGQGSVGVGGYGANSSSSPRRRALFREDPLPLPAHGWNGDGEIYSMPSRSENGRKRPANSSSGSSGTNNMSFDFSMLGPDSKRLRL